MNELPRPATTSLPAGSYPAMLTPFHDDGAIDWGGVDRLTDHCIETGAAGIFACGLSAEVLQMDDDEKVRLADRIIRRVAGQIPVVAGAISVDGIERLAALIGRVHDVGADQVAVGVAHMADEAANDIEWIERADELLGRIPADVNLAMYECPLPYHRLLNDDAIRWTAESGRFVFLKDTCCDIATIGRRIDLIRDSPLQMFNANTATLTASLRAGACGFCGIGANFMPELYVWLCRHYDSDPEVADELQQFLDSTFKVTEDSTYPASAKSFLQRRGVDIGTTSRKVPGGITPEGDVALNELLANNEKWLSRVSA